ncbi:MAG TPA: polysaccharide deacetylase family protein [Rhodopila sp.]|nr:polysaccharide deacetylase family protein [Rhodopila sp.]
MPASPLAQALGVERGIILHVDDLGMCHSGNQAFLDLYQRGLVSCGSVMVPCPWFSQIAAAGPSGDVGVHLTLTSEWEHYRWRPLSTVSPASGLIDADGYFWRDVASLRRHMVVEAAELELHAQVEWALAAGLIPTHLDAHMAAAMLPELLPCHIALARDYGLVPVLPRHIRFAPDQAAYDSAVAGLSSAGMKLPDAFRGTPAVPPDKAVTAYRHLIDTLPAGITHVALHCAAPGDIDAITPGHAGWRTREYALLANETIAHFCRAAGVAVIGYRAIQTLWATTSAPSGMRGSPAG